MENEEHKEEIKESQIVEMVRRNNEELRKCLETSKALFESTYAIMRIISLLLNNDKKRGGSITGRSANKFRDFEWQHRQIEALYFGEYPRRCEDDFGRKFCTNRSVFWDIYL